MTLKLRVSLFLSTVFALLAISLFLVFDNILMSGFKKLEQETVLRNTARVVEAVRALQTELRIKAEEWGTWDDSYEFISNQKAEYEKSNLSFDALNQLKLRHFFMVGQEQKVVRAIFVDTEQAALAEIVPETQQLFLALAERVIKEKRALSGLVRIGNGVFLVGGAAVTNSAGDAAPKGVVLFTRNFAEEEFTKISEQTRNNIRFRSLPDIVADPEWSAQFAQARREGQPKLVLLPEVKNVFGIDLAKDVFNQPVLGIQLSMERELLAQGLEARNLVTSYVLAFTLLAVALALAMLSRMIISPLKRIGSQTKTITAQGLDNKRVSLVGDREIKELAVDINRMLDSLERAQAEVLAARKLAESANQAKSMFIARVSHELRNPIGGIVGLNNLILKREQSRAVWDLVQMSNSAAEGLLSIINEILDYHKLEAGQLSFDRLPFNSRALIREVMSVMQARVEGKVRSEDSEGIDLVCYLDPKLDEQLIGDAQKLKQIIINLLGNAIKFTQEGCVGLKVEVLNIERGTQTVKWTVWDTGIGIPASKIDRVFEPFKQADENVSRQYQGTGLGLAIVKQFAEGMGGNVSVHSVLDEGSEFSVVLNFTRSLEYSERPYLSLSEPLAAVVVLPKSAVAESLCAGLARLGVQVTQLELRVLEKSSEAIRAVLEADLLLVGEEAVGAETLRELLKERKSSAEDKTFILLKPSRVELKEKLYAEGFTDIFTLPVLAEDLLLSYQGRLEQIAPSQEMESSLKFRRKLRVLVADDMPTNRVILEEMLAEAGHTVITVDDGRELVERLKPMISGVERAEKFDIVFTDISMPIMDGDAATREIRRLETQGKTAVHVPILAITGHAFKEEQERIRQAGVDGVIVKPIRAEQIAAEFERLLVETSSRP